MFSAAVAATTISGIALASPASASTTITRDDAVCADAPGPESFGAAVEASTGDVLEITGNLTNCNTFQIPAVFIASQSDVVLGGGGTVTLTVAPDAYQWSGDADFTSIRITFGTFSGDGSFAVWNSNPNANAFFSWLLRLNLSNGSHFDETLHDTPASVIQQFGKPDVGNCEDAASPDMNWAGVASGGWSESWAQWMHDGNGGAVCTRTLEYQQGHSRWMVN